MQNKRKKLGKNNKGPKNDNNKRNDELQKFENPMIIRIELGEESQNK